MEHFIETIKSYPCLWNRETEEYKTIHNKEVAWKCVAKECKISDVREARHIWKKLRDSHRQALRKRKSSDSQWKYENAMSFLTPHFKMKLPRASQYAIEQFENSFQIESDNESQNSELSEPVTKKGKKVIEVNMNLLKSETEESCIEKDILGEDILITGQENRSMKLFFESMSEMCKSLPEYKQIQVQRHVFNIVMDAKEENIKRSIQSGRNLSYSSS